MHGFRVRLSLKITLQPKTCRPVAEADLCHTREKTSGTRGTYYMETVIKSQPMVCDYILTISLFAILP